MSLPNPWGNSPPYPNASPGCSWCYKLLPFVEQGNLYNNWSYLSPVKVFMDPARPGTGLSTVTWTGQQDNSVYNAGAITDYAANVMVIGSGMNTAPEAGYGSYGLAMDPTWSSSPSQWQGMFNYTIQKIADGSSNTVLLGIKALATNSYGQRGQEYITLSNGVQSPADDEPIANDGAGQDLDGNWSGCFGLVRGHCPDTIAWWSAPLGVGQYGNVSCSSAPNINCGYFPGNKYGLAPSAQNWFPYTFQIIQDAPVNPSSGVFNRWGSAYAGGSLFAMADGSVHMAAYSTPNNIVIAMLTPFGGEAYISPW